MSVKKVQELKDKGNQCIKEANYAEAIYHYTHAIKLDPGQYQLYSNRSLAFLKMQQYYFAREDAVECIRLKPDWAKAHYRKGEVEFECNYFEEALHSFRQALQFQGDDRGILEAISKVKKEQYKIQSGNVQIPWVGAGLGFVFGVLIVVADQIFMEEPLLINPLLKLLVIMITSALSYTGAHIYRYYSIKSKRSMLDPPVDLLEEEPEVLANSKEKSSPPENLKPSNKTRQRSKKNKS